MHKPFLCFSRNLLANPFAKVFRISGCFFLFSFQSSIRAAFSYFQFFCIVPNRFQMEPSHVSKSYLKRNRVTFKIRLMKNDGIPYLILNEQRNIVKNLLKSISGTSYYLSWRGHSFFLSLFPTASFLFISLITHAA